MRIVDIRERSIPISRYADPALPSGGLTTSVVAVVTDVVCEGAPVVGFGFGSIGRYAQSGLIRDRFVPRLLAAAEAITDQSDGNLDPIRAWDVMMRGEKAGGHGERCVALGTVDMALWDAAAKIAQCPLYRMIARRFGREPRLKVPVYAAGGYYYPERDLERLTDEIRSFRDLGYTRVKIKIGGQTLARDLRRIEAALAVIGGGDRLAIDAMNMYSASESMLAADRLRPYGLWWFEDICDPLDFQTLAAVAACYPGAIGVGEALFSAAEAKLLARHAGLRSQIDVLLFDPVHCYGLPGYVAIMRELETYGWTRDRFWPHGGHLFSLHVAAGLGLGGIEANPLSFMPFGDYASALGIVDGTVHPPEAPGIGFELQPGTLSLFAALFA